MIHANTSDRQANRLLLVATLFVAAIISLGSLIWIHIDTRPQPVLDEYVRKTLLLADGLANQKLVNYPVLIYRATIGPRPPLYQVMAAPLLIIGERSADTILLINVLCLVVLGTATFYLGKLVAGAATGFVAATLVLTYPLIINLTKLTRPHSILPAITALVFWVALLIATHPTVWRAWTLVFLLFLTFALHPSGMFLLAGPVGLSMIYSIWGNAEGPSSRSFPDVVRWTLDRLKARHVTHGILPGISMLLLIAGSWLFVKWDQLVGLVDVATRYFAGREGFFYYIETLPLAISPFLVIVFAGSYILLFVEQVRTTRKTPIIAIVLAWPILMFIGANAMFGGKAWDFFVGVLPVVAVISAAGVIWLCNPSTVSKHQKWLKRIGLATLLLSFGVAAMNYGITAWGVPRNTTLLRAVGTKEEWEGRRLFYPDPPRGGDWQMSTILGLVNRHSNCRTNTCRVVLLSHRPDDFSDEAFEYLVTQDYPAARIQVQRLAPDSNGLPNWLMADYAVFLAKRHGSSLSPTTTDEHERTVIRFIERAPDEAGFQRLYTGELPTGEVTVLLKRRRQLSADEVARALRVTDAQ